MLSTQPWSGQESAPGVKRECARGAAGQAGGGGRGAHHAHWCHHISDTTSWELESWKQASEVLLLKSSLAEPTGPLCRGCWSQDGALPEKRPYEVPAH